MLVWVLTDPGFARTTDCPSSRGEHGRRPAPANGPSIRSERTLNEKDTHDADDSSRDAEQRPGDADPGVRRLPDDRPGRVRTVRRRCGPDRLPTDRHGG